MPKDKGLFLTLSHSVSNVVQYKDSKIPSSFIQLLFIPGIRDIIVHNSITGKISNIKSIYNGRKKILFLNKFCTSLYNFVTKALVAKNRVT